MVKRLRVLSLSAVLVCLAGGLPDVNVSALTGDSGSNPAVGQPATNGLMPASLRSHALASPIYPPAPSAEQFTGTDYPQATWIPAAPTNFSLADRPSDYPVDMIVLHDTEVPFAQAIHIFQDPTRQVSANYVVSANGQIAQTVLEKDIAWHAGNWDYNTRAIGIEEEGYAYIPGSFTRAEYQASAHLAASICSRWGVPMDRSHVIGHYQVPDADHPGLFGGYSHRTDPGPYWDWSYFIGLAASYAAGLPSPPRMMVDPVAVNGLNSATVTWQTARSCRLPILGYKVVAQPGDVSSYLPATATTVTFNNLQPGTSYTFTVTATNADGQNSLTSNVAIPGRCNAVQLSAAPSSPQPYGSTVLVYGASSGCLKPLYAFALLAPGASLWELVQPYSTSSTFYWNTTGHAPGDYSIRILVQAADSPGTYADALATYDGYRDLADTVAPSPCSSVTVSADPPHAAASGTLITITAIAAGCATPQFEFWMRPAAEQDWQLVQSYGADAIYNWDSLGETTGVIYIEVRARDSSEVVASDAFATIWYSVTNTRRRDRGWNGNTE